MSTGTDAAISELSERLATFGHIDRAEISRPYRQFGWWRVTIALWGPGTAWAFSPRYRVYDSATLVRLAAIEALGGVGRA